MKRKSPDLSPNHLLRYLQQLWPHKSVRSCCSVEEAIEAMWALEDTYVPEGFDGMCVIHYGRMPVRGVIWTLTANKELTKMALENADEDGRGYMLLCDETLEGIDAIMLCAISINDTHAQAQDDISYVVKSWMKSGAPNILIGSYADKVHGGIVTLVTAQLKSLIKC